MFIVGYGTIKEGLSFVGTFHTVKDAKDFIYKHIDVSMFKEVLNLESVPEKKSV